MSRKLALVVLAPKRSRKSMTSHTLSRASTSTTCEHQYTKQVPGLPTTSYYWLAAMHSCVNTAAAGQIRRHHLHYANAGKAPASSAHDEVARTTCHSKLHSPAYSTPCRGSVRRRASPQGRLMSASKSQIVKPRISICLALIPLVPAAQAPTLPSSIVPTRRPTSTPHHSLMSVS